MTYCVAMQLDAGMIFASDSRTNAGVDNIAKHSKMHQFVTPGERVIIILTSGNLSVTQNSISLLEQQARSNGDEPNIYNCTSMFDAATLLGESLREVKRRDGPTFMAHNIDANAGFIIGGQIKGERPRLFMLYNEGNFIESSPVTPYFQIGEVKYGKPIIDRVINSHTALSDAAKCTLVSFDSTMRSNLSVGLPIDMAIMETDALAIKSQRRIDESDDYFRMIHSTWGNGLRELFRQLPDPDWV
ncbi:MAG: peptidase [Burkholderiaceae bacterium]|nr:MAG: peptidase [Burkholderiaceae bacterium]